MFQSISYSYSNGKWIVIDSDFEESVYHNNQYLPACIIKVYSRRNLNVAYNLVLLMQHINKNYANWSIDNQISWYKEDIKDFEQYLPDINKYLSLI